MTGSGAAGGAKAAVRVTIGGEEFTVRSELAPEYTREVAAYVDAALKRVKDALPTVETQKAAILAALAITDELFQARRGDRELAGRIGTLAEEVARLLPPAKRGGRASGQQPAPE
jgi:cell division protein ZapA